MYGKPFGSQKISFSQRKQKNIILTCLWNCVWLHELAWLMGTHANVHFPGPLWSRPLINGADPFWLWVMAPPVTRALLYFVKTCLHAGSIPIWQPCVVHLQNGGIHPPVVRAVQNMLQTALLLVHLFKLITLRFTFGVVEFQKHYLSPGNGPAWLGHPKG